MDFRGDYHGTVSAVATHLLTTEAAAVRLGIKPQTLRAAYCRAGNYGGCRPTKKANLRLVWPADQIDRIAAGLPPTSGDAE